jgi:hypothetical protein
MAFCPLQPFDDFPMTLVLMTVFVVAHRKAPCNDMDRRILSPWGG